MNAKVLLSYISGERFWEHEKPLPQQLQISINVNLVDFEILNKEEASSRFIVSVQYVPSVGQVVAKGKLIITGEENEIKQIREANEKKQVPLALVQVISNFTIGEMIIISKALGIPPPLPLLMPSAQEKPQSSSLV
ncbi:MAG: hypothetical protein QXS21_04950 [Thermoproteota archaeon]|nr:hypothetical protein [Candidatus Brockarchaeota archaeon]MBO3768179.1 hypothetical protein [Candidatus Brockarchaeota archaeon]MBO3801303.1 hypothetical protein [Candidatus Brockarchaeota archaeon]